VECADPGRQDLVRDDLIAFLAARLDEDEDWLVEWADGLERKRRELKAKRAIVALREAAHDPRFDDQWNSGYERAMRDVLGCLADIYSDRPGYRQEWAP
jgi:Family of unknown function (DUF6221)